MRLTAIPKSDKPINLGDLASDDWCCFKHRGKPCIGYVVGQYGDMVTVQFAIQLFPEQENNNLFAAFEDAKFHYTSQVIPLTCVMMS